MVKSFFYQFHFIRKTAIKIGLKSKEFLKALNEKKFVCLPHNTFYCLVCVIAQYNH